MIMIASWLQLVAGLALLIGAVVQLSTPAESDEGDEDEPWGFNVIDGGVCDGGNYDGWEE